MNARILYLVNIPRFFVTHRLPLAEAARAAGYDIHVATSMYDEENVERIRAAGFPFHPLPLHQHSTTPWHEAQAFMAIDRLLRDLKPDLVHHVTIKAILYGGAAAYLSRVPAVVNAVSGLGYVFSATGFKVRVLRAGSSLAYRLVLRHPNSRTIFQNPDDRDLFVNRRFIDASHTQVIKGSGVDMTVFVPQPETAGMPVVLYAGRLLWQKGIGEFIEAARRLPGQARFVVAGISEAGNPSAVAPHQLQEWHDSGVIEWLGQRADMPAVFAQSHIVCLPSAYGEGIPKVLIEAAACGRAIVTTDSPGCREITRHNHNGLLVPVRDVDALCAALLELINNPARRQQMGAAGRELALSEFSLDHINQSTLAIYETLLANSASHKRN